nr:NAD(P)-dependent oxidoreductase [Pseudomonadota bacterium]
MSEKARIGFVGIGRMGRPMCRHILGAGFQVAMYDPVEAAMEPVIKIGGKATKSPRELAGMSDIMFVMPGFYNEVEEAICGADGLLAGAARDSVIVVASTITPQQAKNLAARCADKGVNFIDAPVCQGERGAEEAYLLWLVGGREDILERVRPAMEPCGKDIYHLGDVGAGMVGKAMNNM